MCLAGTFAVDKYAERHGGTLRLRSHDEVDVAGVEPEEDPASGAVEHARPGARWSNPLREPNG